MVKLVKLDCRSHQAQIIYLRRGKTKKKSGLTFIRNDPKDLDLERSLTPN